jgi:hypothetical protein
MVERERRRAEMYLLERVGLVESKREICIRVVNDKMKACDDATAEPFFFRLFYFFLLLVQILEVEVSSMYSLAGVRAEVRVDAVHGGQPAVEAVGEELAYGPQRGVQREQLDLTGEVEDKVVVICGTVDIIV